MSTYDTSRFSRTVSNEQKMGAYYTDLAHCRDIAKMFKWPEDEVCVLEPSIGDGSAVIEVTKAKERPGVKIYGVELNDTVAAQTAKNEHISVCVKADFLEEITSRRDVFTFCFANPPYLNQTSDYGYGKERTERRFLDKLGDYLKRGGILCWVVSVSTFSDPAHVRMWLRDYDTLAVFKFREPEFSKFHQLVAVGKRRTRGIVTDEDIQKFLDYWINSGLRDLPDDLTPQIPVMPSKQKSIDVFTTKIFRPELAMTWINEHGLGEDMAQAFAEGITEKKYVPAALGRPPIPLKKDSEYLLLTSGFTDGLVGDEQKGTLHLMRGVAQVVDHERVVTSMDDDDMEEKASKIVVTSSTEIEVRIIETDGTIRLLGKEEKKEEE